MTIPPFFQVFHALLCPPGHGGYYKRRIPIFEKSGTLMTDYYRLVYRAMLPTPNERTLISAIYPPKLGHINGVQSTAFLSKEILLLTASFGFSIVADFFIKTTGRTNLHYIWHSFPLIESDSDKISKLKNLKIRTLLLNSLTRDYTDLWQECWQEDFQKDCWA